MLIFLFIENLGENSNNDISGTIGRIISNMFKKHLFSLKILKCILHKIVWILERAKRVRRKMDDLSMYQKFSSDFDTKFFKHSIFPKYQNDLTTQNARNTVEFDQFDRSNTIGKPRYVNTLNVWDNQSQKNSEE